nr:MAG TPA: hypothetical protein [Caudoviricetes sp.]
MLKSTKRKKEGYVVLLLYILLCRKLYIKSFFDFLSESTPVEIFNWLCTPFNMSRWILVT